MAEGDGAFRIVEEDASEQCIAIDALDSRCMFLRKGSQLLAPDSADLRGMLCVCLGEADCDEGGEAGQLLLAVSDKSTELVEVVHRSSRQNLRGRIVAAWEALAKEWGDKLVKYTVDLSKAKKLLEKAGYTLTRSSKTDLVVQYYIERKIYSIPFINAALYDCGLPMLKTGSVRD